MYGQPNYFYPQTQFQTQMRAMDYLSAQYPQQNSMIKGRPVASIDEVKAAQIDFDGSLHVFTDIGNKKIYTKQINMDGTASLHTYILEDVAEPNASTIEYVTREEFNQVLSQLHSLIESKSFSKEDERKALSLNNF